MSDFMVNTCGGSLHNVAKTANQMRQKLDFSNRGKRAEVEIKIYMNSKFWFDCMSTIRGSVPPFALEFYDSHCNPKGDQKLLGNPVYVVNGESHPDCVIYGRLIHVLRPLYRQGGDKYDENI